MIHTVELDIKTFNAARKLIGCTELESVRLVRCKAAVNVDQSISESNQVSLFVKVKSGGKRISPDKIDLAFNFTLTGDVGDPPTKVVDISLRLNARYQIPPDVTLEQSDIKAFALSNGMLNVWPYWREFVQSMTSRAGLPPLTVPLFRLHQKPATKK